MNILILNWRDKDHPFSGGAEIVTMEHAKGWIKRGHNITWFTSWYPGAKHEEYVDGIRMIRQAGSLTVYPAAMLYVLLYSHEHDLIIDEVHGFPFFSAFFTKKPVVVFIHEIAGEIWDFMYPFPINVIGKFVEKHYFWFYRHCLFWTDASSTVEELVKRGIQRRQCTAIPCPISVDKTRDNEQKAENRKEKIPTYLFVSRVVKMKGIEEIIKAFSFIAREQKTAKLWIVGGGEGAYIQELKTMIEEYGVANRVKFFGNVSERRKFQLMSRAHLVLHASVKEGWGLVVLEAASVGTPAIVYNVSGLRDVVRNGKTGIVLEENNAKEMAREAIMLINNKKKYEDFQKNGLLWAKSLTWEKATQKSMVLLEDVRSKS